MERKRKQIAQDSLEKKVATGSSSRSSSRRQERDAREAGCAKLSVLLLVLLLGGSFVAPGIINMISQAGTQAKNELNNFKNDMTHPLVQLPNPKLPETPSNIGDPRYMTLAQVHATSSAELQNNNDTTPEIIVTDTVTLSPNSGLAELNFTLQLDTSNPKSQQTGDLFVAEKTGQEIFIPDSTQAAEIVSDLQEGKTVSLSGLDGELLTTKATDATKFGNVFFTLPDNLQIGTAKVFSGISVPAEGEIAYYISPVRNSRRNS